MAELRQFEPNGYNPTTGIYASTYIFQGNWESELRNLAYTSRSKLSEVAEIREFDDEKGIHSGYLYNSFKSANGRSDFHDQIKDFWDEEDPADYSYTESYYNSPKLRAICDWFQCEKTRIRIFQQKPGHYMQMHTDFDNQRGNELGETLRIFVQLNDMPGGAWYRFRTADSEVTINLQKGQFLIFNPDNTGHQTENLTDIPRDTFMMVVKRNEWIENLANNPRVNYVDVDQLVAQQTELKEVVAA